MKIQIKRPQAGRQSLTAALAIAFFVLSAVALLISSGLQLFFNIQTQRETMANKQQLIAQEAAKTVSSFIQEKFSVLETTFKLVNPATTSPQEQKNILDGLLGLQPAFRHLVLLNAQDQELVHTSRLSEKLVLQFIDQLKDEPLVQIQQRGKYISPIYIDETTSEPLVIIAVPANDALGNFQGTLVAEVNLKFMWDLVDQLKVGEAGWAYVVDRQGTLIAFRETGRVLKGENVSRLQVVSEFIQNPAATPKTEVTPYPGITGDLIVGTYVPLVTPDWAVVTELPWQEAYYEVIWQAAFSIGVTLVMAVVAGLVGIFMARRLAVPLVNLTETASRITGGEMELQAVVGGPREVSSLATAFNDMTTQLRELIGSLEQRIADRTQRLEIVASLGERLNAILDPQDLLREVVNQIKQQFGYYHTHIYLFDDNHENLVMAEGVGAIGVEMKRIGHRIPLNAPASLVARAARTTQIVKIDNVFETADWLPNPLLPDTRAEMAVPIMQKGEVIGVLDVQADRVAALDESDANLLRSVANQVAVALTNARLFAQTTQSKEEAELAKEKAELAKKDIEIANRALETQVWQTAGQAQLNDKMRGEQDIPTLARNIIQQLCHYLHAPVGTLYALENNILRLAGSYAYTHPQNLPTQFRIGESLVGQAALEKQPLVITNVADDYIAITSSLGEMPPKNILVAPSMYDGQVVGVVELAALSEFTPNQIEFLQTALESIAIAFNTAQARARINELLIETQQQTEELQTQEEELRAANEELEAQTESLRVSETKLKANQAALESTNTQLEEKALALQEQRAEVDRQNRELKAAQQELERKAQELALASKYKSEFLANMSHELRTPLNSLLILARMMADNKEGNLTSEQIESAQIMYSGGVDLLNLINDILDLSKVESGKMLFNFESMPLADLASAMRTQFNHLAEEKKLTFNITLAEDLPPRIKTDTQRAKQIVKNLLSNAFKFTREGSISLTIYRPDLKADLSRCGLEPFQAIAINVADTGIGMTLEQQKIIFEAFQQADGSTSRQYGGTGLGLSISRELAAKLGGQINVESQAGQGSTFTLYLPIEMKPAGKIEAAPAGQKKAPPVKAAPLPPPVSPPPVSVSLPAPVDDRANLEPGDKIVLVIEDDDKFARIIQNYAHKKTFKCLLAADGKTGLSLVKTYQPAAIILDLNLPDISGWDVLEILKNDPDARHIPVHIMSVADEVLEAYRKGAMGYLTKPVGQEQLDEAFQEIGRVISKEIKTLLLVEDDAASRLSIKKLLGGSDVQISEVEQGQAALDLLRTQRFDCMILDLSLPDMTGFEVLSKIDSDDTIARCPVIVYTGRDLTPEQNLELMNYADSVIVKGVKSPERLLDETALFLHRVVADMPADKQQTIKQLYSQDDRLKGKKILIVDDDMRNSFALSKLLSEKEITVKIAADGQKALDLLAKDPAFDLILMDIMMPVLDGYETTKRIRAQQQFKTLPILALTAKAMTGDREKCLAAGASDYLSKPIDIDRLFSMLRVWLYQ